MANRSTLESNNGVVKYYWDRQLGPGIDVLHDIRNSTALTWADATDTTSISGITVDADSVVHTNSQAILGAREPMQFYINANAALGTQTFFVADRAMVISAIEYDHATAGNDASAVTCQVYKDSGTQAPGGGAAVMTNTFNCKATADTYQSATLLAVNGDGQANTGISLAAGDRLSIVFTGTLTTLAGVVLTVFARPGFKEVPAVYAMKANGSLATQSFFLANRDFVVTGVKLLWSAAATNGGTVTIDVTQETTTGAPGGGTTILAAAISAKTAANTVVSAPLTATAANLKILAGNRLSVKFTGTLTALAGVVVVVYLGPVGGLAYVGQVEPTFTLTANGSLATQGFFIADRDYQIVDASGVWATAGTDGSAVTLDMTIDKGVTAPGGGTSCLAGTMNVKATANTVVVPGVNSSRRQTLLSQGDMLSVKFTGVLTALAGVTVTASLRPI